MDLEENINNAYMPDKEIYLEYNWKLQHVNNKMTNQYKPEQRFEQVVYKKA